MPEDQWAAGVPSKSPMLSAKSWASVKHCRNYLPVIIIALILGAAGTVCQIVGPDKLKDMTNEIVKGLPAIVNGRPVMNSVDFGTVGHIAWTLVALYVGYAVLGYVQSWMMANVTQRTGPATARVHLGQNQQTAAQILRQG